MNKNTLTGLIVMGAILFGFTWYQSKQSEKAHREQAVADSIAKVNDDYRMQTEATAGDSTDISGVGSRSDAKRAEFLGQELYEASQGAEVRYTVENDVAIFTFSNKGGRLVGVTLKNYDTFRGEKVKLMADSAAVFDLSFFIQQPVNTLQIRTGDYCFTTDLEKSVVVGEEGRRIVMRLPVDSTACVEYVYTIPKDNYMIGFEVNFVDMNRILSNQSDFEIAWENLSPQNEHGFDNENNYTTLAYKYPGTKDNDMEDLGISKEGKERKEVSRIKWIAYKQQFFSSVFIAEEDFQNATMSHTAAHVEGLMKHYRSKIAVTFKPEQHYAFRFYYGPNHYTTLKKYDLGLQKMVPLGWGIFGWVNRFLVIPVFNFLGKFISSFGLIILLLTIFIKIIIAPLTYKSYLSSAKMRLLKPEIDLISAKFPKQEDAMKKQQATMALYKSAGVSPLGGCLPLLIQMPVLIALFRFFPTAIDLRGEGFLWATDLSSYDSILTLPFKIPFYGDHISLFTLLMTVTVFISSKLNYNQTASAGPQMAGMKFMTLYLMPVMLLVWFNNYASGLTYYYFVSNLISIGQTYAFRYAVDENKLHRQMQDNAKKPPKPKSKFQQRYEAAAKAQQQAQQQQAKKRK